MILESIAFQFDGEFPQRDNIIAADIQSVPEDVNFVLAELEFATCCKDFLQELRELFLIQRAILVAVKLVEN